MAHKFDSTEKEVKEFNDNYFGFGVHKVQIVLFEADKTENDKEFVEVSFCDPEDIEKADKVRVWFTTGQAANFSFNTLRQIAVHNTDEISQDIARNAVDAVSDTDELVALLNEKLIGKEMWFSKYYDPKRTYVSNRDGRTYKSVNKNIYGYEPKLKSDLISQDQQNIKADDFLADAGPAPDAGGANIPDNWS